MSIAFASPFARFLIYSSFKPLPCSFVLTSLQLPKYRSLQNTSTSLNIYTLHFLDSEVVSPQIKEISSDLIESTMSSMTPAIKVHEKRQGLIPGVPFHPSA